MSKENRFGLSRYIKPDIKQTIRKACGFGCAICGNPIGTYEHIEPTFEDAREHDPDKMTYLCSSHQDQSSRGLLSKASIWKGKHSPRLMKVGRAKSPFIFDTWSALPSIWVGPVRIIGFATIIEIDGERIFAIDPPEIPGAPFRINASFTDQNHDLIFQIVDNELVLNPKSWDVKVTGRSLIIRKSSRHIIAEIVTLPPNSIYIKRLHARYKAFPIDINGDRFTVRHGFEGPLEIEVTSPGLPPPAVCVLSSVNPHGQGMESRGGSFAIGAQSQPHPLYTKKIAKRHNL
jgi:hypothetical protein